MTEPRANFKLSLLSASCLLALPVLTVPNPAGAQVLEEVIVTARKREETLQDVPVTVAALSQRQLENAGIDSLTDIGRLIPNMQINDSGSGNGSAIYLRGIGSSTISAAFDPAVALNIDGVVTAASRLILAGQVDLRQIEVLKGPQALYFGRSATAGVVSILTNDPGDKLEFMARGAYEPEHDETIGEVMVSGPITDNFGARLVLRGSEAEEVTENLNPAASNDFRGNERTDGRLTLTWAANQDLFAKLKVNYSEYEDDGPNYGTEMICPEGQMQRTLHPFGPILPRGVNDCDLNETIGQPDVPPELLPAPDYPTFGDWNNGVPYVDQESVITSLQLDWDINDNYSLTSITAYLDLENDFLDIFDYSLGLGASHARNTYESWSQEFRLETDFDGAINFSAGLYYADIEQEFITGQNAVNASQIVGPDPLTGNGYDWDKEHYTDTESWSGFAAVYWDITDKLELTAGARYSDDDKDGEILITYMHGFLQSSLGFLPAGTRISEGLEFDDDDWSPEVALNWQVSDDVSFYAAYKEGYKAGGFDNSALPSATLGSGDVSPLLYDSETGEGGEVGMRATLLDGAMRLNATAFYYDYKDLQVQLFDSNVIQFFTSNASKLNTQGLEFEGQWATPVEGLTLRTAWAYTDAQYEDTFFNPDGEDVDGEDRERNAEIAGFFGGTYEMPLGAGWGMSLSADARYSDDYILAPSLTPWEQDSYWQYDASIRIYTSDNRHELAILGVNLNDEVVAYNVQSRPFACATDPADPEGPCAVVTNQGLDQATPSSQGRKYTIQYTFRF